MHFLNEIQSVRIVCIVVTFLVLTCDSLTCLRRTSGDESWLFRAAFRFRKLIKIASRTDTSAILMRACCECCQYPVTKSRTSSVSLFQIHAYNFVLLFVPSSVDHVSLIMRCSVPSTHLFSRNEVVATNYQWDQRWRSELNLAQSGELTYCNIQPWLAKVYI
jgi:hypothetical protein